MRDRTCVPHGVHFPARFSDVAAGTEDHFPATGTKADFSFGDDGVLIFSSMQVRLHEGPDRKWVLNHGNHPVGVASPQFESNTDPAKIAGHPTLAWLDDRQRWRAPVNLVGLGHR